MYVCIDYLLVIPPVTKLTIDVCSGCIKRKMRAPRVPRKLFFSQCLDNHVYNIINSDLVRFILSYKKFVNYGFHPFIYLK